MKKIVFVLALLGSSFSYSQTELKLDIADALIIRSLEVSFENYLNEESSFGISALVNLTNDSVSFRYNEDFMIAPYYRHYFSANETWNFFGEGFIGINSGKDNGVKYTDGALGVAVGMKYVASRGLVIDLYGGLGRNLFGSISPVIVPRVGLNIGWRL